MDQLRRLLQPAPGRARRGPPGAGLGALEVGPRKTDPQITDWVEPHLIFRDPTVTFNGHIFLFLAGSNGIPGRQTLLLGLAARLGYLAINLRYPNTWTVGGLCRKSSDPNCHERIRRHIIEGEDSGELPSLNPRDCIVNRFGKLLEWLGREGPDEARDGFLFGGEIRWDKVVVAGHSQGGGHAALIGKYHLVRRVVMLGAPADYCFSRNTISPWLGRPGQTPAGGFYGFAHAEDQGYTRIVDSWSALGLARFGDVVDVDREQPPYHMSHQLTSHAPAARGKFHGSVAMDGATALDARGTPLFMPAWRYLLDISHDS